MPQRVNYSDTTPAAPAGSVNNHWQADAPSTDPTVVRNISTSTPIVKASGASHAPGLCPDTPSVAGLVKFLREDASWDQVALSILLDTLINSPLDGQVLTYESATSLWKNKTPAASSGGGFAGVNQQSVNYTLQSSDNNKLIQITGSSAVQVNLPSAGPALLQTISSSTIASGHVKTPNVTFSAGSLVVVVVIVGNSILSFPTSVTDGLGNTYNLLTNTKASNSSLFSGCTISVYYAKNVTAGTTQVDAAASFGGFGCVSAHEFQGMDTAAPADQSTSASGGGTNQVGPLTTTAAKELLFVASENTNAPTAPAGFSQATGTLIGTSFYEMVNSTGTFTPSETVSGGFIASFATFKQNTGFTSPLPTPFGCWISNASTALVTLHSAVSINGVIADFVIQPGEAVFLAFDGSVFYTDFLFSLGTRSRKSITAAYTATYADHAIFCSAAAAYALTLPDATKYVGELLIKKTDATANAITVTPVSSQKIDGAANFALSAQWKYIRLQSDGANWMNVGSN